MPCQAGLPLSHQYSSSITGLVSYLLALALGLLWILATRGLQGPSRDTTPPKQCLLTLPLAPRVDMEWNHINWLRSSTCFPVVNWLPKSLNISDCSPLPSYPMAQGPNRYKEMIKSGTIRLMFLYYCHLGPGILSCGLDYLGNCSVLS